MEKVSCLPSSLSSLVCGRAGPRLIDSFGPAVLWRRILYLGVLICLVCAGVAGQTPSAQAADPSGVLRDGYEQRRREIAQLMEAATVWVFVANEDEYASGSGFVVADGYILTNAHVTASVENAQIFVMNERLPLTEAVLVASTGEKDAPGNNDFSLLRIRLPKGVALPALSFSTDVRRMDRVSAWGYPGMITQFDQSMIDLEKDDGKDIAPPPVVYTEGAVSAIVRNDGECIIHTAAIAAGNSGGPLVNRNGEVVGINTWGYEEDDEGAFVNASLTAAAMLDFLRKNGVSPRMAGGRTQVAGGDGPAFGAAARAGAFGSSGATSASGRTFQSAADMASSVFGGANRSGGQDAGRGGSDEAFARRADPRITDVKAQGYLARAEQGDEDVIVAVGVMYLDGSDGFPKDAGKGVAWLEKGVSQGNSMARAMLGVHYLIAEQRQQRDPVKGLALLRQSAADDDANPEVQSLLGVLLYDGEYLGVPFQPEESLRWARKSADAGDSLGVALLGFHYHDGYAVKVDMAKARELANTAFRAGFSAGKALLAILQYEGDEFARNPARTIALAEEAAEEDEGAAMGLLAYIYAFEEEQEDNVLAEKWARRGAAQADALSQYVLGWLYMNGFVVEKNDAMAWAYLDLAEKKMEDPATDGQTLLQKVERRISAKDEKRARALQQSWFADWGLAAP